MSNTQIPENLKYTKDHEWARVEGKQVTVGVTEHAQNSLGDIVFVELPEVGRELTAGETFGVVESVKAVSDLISPIAGKVAAINEKLVDEPNTINDAPYEGGWIVKIEMTGESTDHDLMDHLNYKDLVDTLA